ncbi:MAG: hypothetical protein R3C10_23625 [Pirellulales bacterium]
MHSLDAALRIAAAQFVLFAYICSMSERGLADGKPIMLSARVGATAGVHWTDGTTPFQGETDVNTAPVSLFGNEITDQPIRYRCRTLYAFRFGIGSASASAALHGIIQSSQAAFLYEGNYTTHDSRSVTPQSPYALLNSQLERILVMSHLLPI